MGEVFCAVGEIVDFNPRTSLPKTGAIPFVDMAALPTSGRDIDQIGQRETASSGSKFQNGDTLLARITPCLENGKGAKASGIPGIGVAQGSTEFIVMRAKDRSDENFVYYLSRHPDFRAHAIQHMSGTSGRQRVAWQSLVDYQIPLLSHEARRDIGELLSALDDKIELNRRMNETLEASARALFRDWFVDFGPVKAKPPLRRAQNDQVQAALGGTAQNEHADASAYLAPEIWSLFPAQLDDEGKPEGWEWGSLGDIIEIAPKEPLKSGSMAPYLEMAALPTAGANSQLPVDREYSSGTRFRNGDTLLARITPCLENGKTCYVQNLPNGAVGWGSTEFIVLRAKSPVPSPVSYLIARDEDFRRHAIRSMTGTSGRQRANADAISGYCIAIPSEPKICLELAELLNPMFDQISSNERESRTLAQTRDRLLPKLMSGEIRVRAAENLVEEVL